MNMNEACILNLLDTTKRGCMHTAPVDGYENGVCERDATLRMGMKFAYSYVLDTPKKGCMHTAPKDGSEKGVRVRDTTPRMGMKMNGALEHSVFLIHLKRGACQLHP